MSQWLSWGALGGAVAIGAAVAGAATEATGSEPTSDLGGLTLLIVFAAGVVALTRPWRIEALAAADALVALALTLEMFSRLGMLFVPVLVLLGFATLRARGLEARDVPEAVKPILIGDWDGRRAEEPREELRRAG